MNTNQNQPRADMLCECGSLKSAVTFDCVRGKHCPQQTGEGTHVKAPEGAHVTGVPRVTSEMRSLVRELNHAGWKQCRAFYHNGEKFNCARIHKGEFQLGMCQRDWKTFNYETLNILALA